VGALKGGGRVRSEVRQVSIRKKWGISLDGICAGVGGQWGLHGVCREGGEESVSCSLSYLCKKEKELGANSGRRTGVGAPRTQRDASKGGSGRGYLVAVVFCVLVSNCLSCFMKS